MESTTVWNLKPECWSSPLVQETYQEERACDKWHNHNNNNNTYVIDVAVPLTHNLSKTEAEKIMKFEILALEA